MPVTCQPTNHFSAGQDEDGANRRMSKFETFLESVCRLVLVERLGEFKGDFLWYSYGIILKLREVSEDLLIFTSRNGIPDWFAANHADVQFFGPDGNLRYTTTIIANAFTYPERPPEPSRPDSKEGSDDEESEGERPVFFNDDPSFKFEAMPVFNPPSTANEFGIRRSGTASITWQETLGTANKPMRLQQQRTRSMEAMHKSAKDVMRIMKGQEEQREREAGRRATYFTDLAEEGFTVNSVQRRQHFPPQPVGFEIPDIREALGGLLQVDKGSKVYLVIPNPAKKQGVDGEEKQANEVVAEGKGGEEQEWWAQGLQRKKEKDPQRLRQEALYRFQESLKTVQWEMLEGTVTALTRRGFLLRVDPTRDRDFPNGLPAFALRGEEGLFPVGVLHGRAAGRQWTHEAVGLGFGLGVVREHLADNAWRQSQVRESEGTAKLAGFTQLNRQQAAKLLAKVVAGEPAAGREDARLLTKEGAAELGKLIEKRDVVLALEFLRHYADFPYVALYTLEALVGQLLRGGLLRAAAVEKTGALLPADVFHALSAVFNLIRVTAIKRYAVEEARLPEWLGAVMAMSESAKDNRDVQYVGLACAKELLEGPWCDAASRMLRESGFVDALLRNVTKFEDDTETVTACDSIAETLEVDIHSKYGLGRTVGPGGFSIKSKEKRVFDEGIFDKAPNKTV